MPQTLEFHQLDRRLAHLRVRHPARFRRLLASLAETGQQTPIVVIQQASRYLVIDGHHRIAALEQLRRDTVDAIVLDTVNEAEALLLVTYTDFVAGLLRAQWRDRQENAQEWRIRRACLPERWALETFPFAKQPGVNRKQIRAFAELDFVAKHENIVFIGPTAVGKTGLASSILMKALQNGLRCQADGGAVSPAFDDHHDESCV